MREHYIDNIKTFSIVLIIIGHSGLRRIYPDFDIWLFSFHVPIFFFVSGYLMESKGNFKKINIAKIFRNYMIPYFCFSVIYQITVEGLNMIAGNRTIAEASAIMFHSIATFDGGDTANWFLFTLFVAEIVYRLERKLLNVTEVFVLNLALLVLPIAIPHNNEYVRGILRTFPAVFFIVCGGLYYIYMEQWKRLAKNKSLILAVVGVLQIVLCIFNGRVDTYGLIFGRITFLYYLDALTAILVIFLFAQSRGDKSIPVITWYGRNTLIIMATHQALIELVYVIDMHTIKVFESHMGAPILLSIVIVLVEIPIILIINRWFYWMLGKKKPVKIIG